MSTSVPLKYRPKYPLFWCLSAQSQAALMQYHYDTYGTVLEPPAPPGNSASAWDSPWHESLEEIDRLMRQPPSRSRG